MNKPGVLVITGPTATGKTALGIQVSAALNGEVVSADSMQVYKLMNIGTAKPTPEEMCGITHHMIDVVEPWEDYSVARYVKEAQLCVDDILSRNKLPVIVGGSGLYIDSLLAGRSFVKRSDPKLRIKLEAQYDRVGGEKMLVKLRDIDKVSADKLYPNDKKRIVRAFEAVLNTGKPLSEHDNESKLQPDRYSCTKFILTFKNRDDLYSKIDKRVDEMISGGLKNEVNSLINKGVTLNHTSMQAIGYKELAEVITSGADLSAAVEKIKMESRRYAKRQLTWFRRDLDASWITWDKKAEISRGVEIIRSFLNEAK